MNYLAENSLPIWVAGAVLLTMAGVVYWQSRSGAALAAMIAVAAITGLLLVVRARRSKRRAKPSSARSTKWPTSSSGTTSTGALDLHRPGASQIRSDVETLMPQVRIEKANIMGTPGDSVDLSQKPPTATVTCRGFVYGTLKRNGMTGGQPVELVMTFVQDGDRWLVKDYTSPKDWRRAVSGGRN